MKNLNIFKSVILLTLFLGLPVQAAKKPIEFLSPYSYGRMTEKMKKSYMDDLRQAWVVFESKSPIKVEQAQTFPTIDFSIFESANAQDTAATTPSCIIGGVVRASVANGKGRFVCPTRGNECDGKANSFRCSPFFGETCISRTPISNLSERCKSSVPETAVTEQRYKELLPLIAKDYDAICKTSDSAGCKYLAIKIGEVTEQYNIQIAELDAKVLTKNTAQNEAKKDAKNASAYGCEKEKRSKYTIPPLFSLPQKPDCAIDSNKDILADLAENGCQSTHANNLYSTKIQTTNKVLLDGQSDMINGILDDVRLDEKTSNNESTYSLRMIKHDISNAPIKAQQVTIKVKQIGNKYYHVDSNGIQTEVKIENTYRPNYLAEHFSALIPARVFEAKTHLADNCRLAKSLKTLRAEGASIAPSTASQKPRNIKTEIGTKSGIK